MSQRVSEMMTICRKNYPAEQNTINQREGFPAAAAVNLWQRAECLFFIRHILRQSIHPQRVFMWQLLFWNDVSTHASTQTRGPYAPLRTFSIFVLITALSLTLAGIYSWGVILTLSCWAERERQMRGGRAPSESIQIWSTSRCYTSEIYF